MAAILIEVALAEAEVYQMEDPSVILVSSNKQIV